MLIVRNKKAAAENTDLEAVISRLIEEVRVLRQAIDEFREDFVHLLRNLPEKLPPPYAHLNTLAESFAVDVPESQTPQKPAATKLPTPPVQVTPSAASVRRTTLFD